MAEDYTARATCECYYKFENGADLGEDNQNQIDLTNNGAAQSATIPDDAQTYCGVSAGNSADFELGETDDMSAVHNDSTEVDDLTAVTALCWARFESLTSNGYMIAKTTAPSVNGWSLSFNAAGGGLLSGWFHDQYNQTAHGFSTATWYFIAMVYDGDDINLYKGTETSEVSLLNGADVTDSMTAATTGGFTLGNFDTGSDYIDGLLCEVAVFSEALSLSEIQEIQADGIEGTAVVTHEINVSECE